jgi:hypothetical protein
MKGQLLFALSLVVCALSWVPRAAAQEPVGDVENACVEQGGQGEVCDTSADCAANAYATVCVERRRGDPTSRRCEIPCEGPGKGSTSAPPRRPARWVRPASRARSRRGAWGIIARRGGFGWT